MYWTVTGTGATARTPRTHSSRTTRGTNTRRHFQPIDGAQDRTKARYAFVYGDLRRIHRTGLIACVYRASERRHKDVELAAHELLQYLDAKTGLKPSG